MRKRRSPKKPGEVATRKKGKRAQRGSDVPFLPNAESGAAPSEEASAAMDGGATAAAAAEPPDEAAADEEGPSMWSTVFEFLARTCCCGSRKAPQRIA